jgi:hypothetical protein
MCSLDVHVAAFLVRVVLGMRLPSIRVTRRHAEWMIGNGRRSSALRVRLHAPGCYGIDERAVVALILVGVGLGERCDRAVEGVRGAEVAGDRDRVADGGRGRAA